MKRLWISVAIMAGIFAGTLANNWYLGRLTGEMTDLLRTAQQYAESGDWETASSTLPRPSSTGRTRRTISMSSCATTRLTRWGPAFGK